MRQRGPTPDNSVRVPVLCRCNGTCATSGVTSKYERRQRIFAGIDDVNLYPVVHTWS